MTLADHLRPDAVVLDLPARTKADVLKALARRAGDLSGRDPGTIERALAARETLGSTGVGAGVALPHAGVAGLAEPVVLFARLARPIDWEAIDDHPIDLVAVVLSPSDGPAASLTLLAKFARLLRGEGVRARMRACADAEGLSRIVAEAED